MKRNLPADLLIGAVAGAAATWLMDLATTALYERQPDEVTKREDDARGGKTAYEIAAEFDVADPIAQKLPRRSRTS